MPKISRSIEQNKIFITKTTLTAMFIALAVVSKLLFSVNIPIFGASGMKVGVSGIFTTIPAIVFGPFYGAVASACSDIFGHLIKPLGPYNPLYTITAFLGGFLKGCIWYLLVKVDKKKLKIVFASFLIVIGTFAVSVHISLYADGISKNFIATKENLPSKGVIAESNKNIASDLVIKLAQYKNDIYTITAAEDTEEITIPEAVVCDNIKSVLRIGKNAFSECKNLKNIYIPSSIKDIDSTAFDGLTDIII
ncbi:ECF transporter S component, partial [Eubacteriales bacterium OttesenSCG-928-G02]|nr:ECF transporter S component [Eubacteriales bacterium OttesenSCG-928-G02]